jgi:hypothetical protein
MKRIRPNLPLAFFAVTLTAGCNTQTANNANLQKGLDHYLSHIEPCLGFTARSFPMTTPGNSPRRDLEALSDVGLVSKSLLTANNMEQIQYDITPKGRASTFPGKSLHMAEPNVFCFGLIAVDQITDFTEPAEADGMHVTRVTYTRKLTHQPSWASDPSIQLAFPNFRPEGYAAHPQTTGMVLTSQGWRVPEDEGH